MFGDPQERIIWHTQGLGNTCTAGSFYVHMLVNNYFYGSSFSSSMTINHSSFASDARAVWHELDVAGGVDVEAQ